MLWDQDGSDLFLFFQEIAFDCYADIVGTLRNDLSPPRILIGPISPLGDGEIGWVAVITRTSSRLVTAHTWDCGELG